MLCDFCRRCLEGMHDPAVIPRIRLKDPTSKLHKEKPLEIEKYVYLHYSTREVYQMNPARRWCIICAPLRRFEYTIMKSGYWSTFEVAVQHTDLRITLRCKDEVIENILVLFSMFDTDNLTMAFDNNTNGPLAQKLISRWVQNCNNHHARCRLDETNTFLPTRLLEIDGASEPPTYCLRFQSECPSDTRYVALSYVWGTDPLKDKLRLLRSTYEDLRQPKPISDLPKTFCDASQVALRLDVQYMWIDSVCIYQDSKEVWEKEAGMLIWVYRNAYVTIAASTGANDRAGLFRDREPRAMARTIVRVKPSADGEPILYLHSCAHFDWGATLYSFILDNKLIERAWCVQERLLSPRVLHFGASEVFWECHETTASESNPKTVLWDPDMGKTPWKPVIILQAPRGRSTSDDDRSAIFRGWYNIVYLYTQCQLTVASDKLVAISGLAEDMRHMLREKWPEMQHRYLAGLWEEDLRSSLCWYTRVPGKRSLDYRAPSWSWASVDNAPAFHSLADNRRYWFVSEQQCKANTECQGPSDTGQVRGGQLELTGIFVTVDMFLATQTKPAFVRCFRNGINGVPLTMPALPPYGRNLHQEVWFDDKDDTPESACFIPIFVDNFRRVELWGLLLARVKETEEYRRVGFVCLQFESKKDVIERLESLERRTVIVI